VISEDLWVRRFAADPGIVGGTTRRAANIDPIATLRLE